MSGENAIEAVRMALAMQDARSRVASANIANASAPNATARRLSVDAPALGESRWAELSEATMRTRVREIEHAASIDTGAPIQVDQEISEMVAASTSYQALAEALSRTFGLMRLAITGRS